MVVSINNVCLTSVLPLSMWGTHAFLDGVADTDGLVDIDELGVAEGDELLDGVGVTDTEEEEDADGEDVGLVEEVGVIDAEVVVDGVGVGDADEEDDGEGDGDGHLHWIPSPRASLQSSLPLVVRQTRLVNGQ